MDSSAETRPDGDDDILHRGRARAPRTDRTILRSQAETLPLAPDAPATAHPTHRTTHATNRRTSIYGVSGRGDSGAGVDGEREGDEVGHYKLLTELGSGGFGTVWLAKRTCDFEQKVAIKVVKQGLDSDAVLERFGQEIQLLALMDHPHVAKVFDAGTTPSGRPYFVMDHVDGRPLTKFADEHRLTIEERLRLFLQVCDAIQYAHYKEIVHRDLKPSNVLVAPDGNGGANAKVIDFGIAKALTHNLSDQCRATESGQMVGTYEYMSPEQAEGDDAAIDGRSDVYSLGVILYELLVGAVPFASKQLRSQTQEEIRRTICQDDPPSPALRLRALRGDGADHARRLADFRRITPSRHARVLAGELGWIPLKAMSKRRDDRYSSPEALAEDIRSYLAGRTVEAVPPTTAYRLRKYVRHHSVALLIACSMAVAAGSFAHRYFTAVGNATVLHPDPEWLVEKTAFEDRLQHESIEWALKAQEQLIADQWKRVNDLRVQNSTDERHVRREESAGGQDGARDGDSADRRIAIAQRDDLIATLKRPLAMHYARQAWFLFRLDRKEEALSSQRLAAAILNEIPSESRRFTEEDLGRLRLFDEALEHYQTRSARDVAPQLWRAPVASTMASTK
jgi:serine/threonine protein kinase